MELTLEEALQHGVAAHKGGKLRDAEHLYLAILRSQPKHPDANHNLGVLAVAVGQPLKAIPFFQLALEANPKIEQFWLSYIDVLIRLDRLDEAHRALVEGERYDVSLDKLDALKQRLQKSAPHNTNKFERGQTLLEKRRAQDEASAAEPSQDQLNHLREHYHTGRLEDAKALATSLTQQFPKHPFGWKVLGVVLQQTGKLAESLEPMRSAVTLSPQDAVAHSNLGATLKVLGKLDEAEASLRKAIDLKPDYAEAHSNLGVTLQELGRLDESISSYVRAINLNANDYNAYSNLGSALTSVRFNKADQTLYPILINLLTGIGSVRPRDIAGAISSLLRLDNLIEDALLNTTAFSDAKKADRAIKTLTQVPLLHHLMRICPLPDLQLEASLVSIRRVLLVGLEQVTASSEIIHFLSTLSLHCFVNEYVYFETKEETELISVLEAAIAESIVRKSQPTVAETLVLATYRPLHQYDWIKKLQVIDQLPEVKMRLVDEPLAERVVAQTIPCLSNINNDVSSKVREQYEESPYPRWVKLAIPQKVKSVSEVCNEAQLHLQSENIKNVISPSVLVAGCGTGQHSIETASRFANCKVTAVDLSRASLAYAQRKTNELGITNIEYLQADILNLSMFEREFDIIESTGVLHHMEEPTAGWRVLADLLKPGGLMSLGLYSQLARQHISKIREEIRLKGIGTSENEIRQWRQSLIESNGDNLPHFTNFRDFFSLNEVRDLVFHVQEHRFTLPQIQHCLDELGLKFCGFKDTNIVRRFKHSFGESSDACDLSLWHQFEEQHPHTFAGMYQFWCQKM